MEQIIIKERKIEKEPDSKNLFYPEDYYDTEKEARKRGEELKKAWKKEGINNCHFEIIKFSNIMWDKYLLCLNKPTKLIYFENE